MMAGRAPAAGERVAAVQKLQVLAPGPGDIAVSYPGKAEQCDGAFGAGQEEDCSYDVEAGATVTLEAKPHAPDPDNGGARSFVRWSDGDCWTTNPCKFVMPNEPVSMVAIFSPAEVRIRITGNVGSRITGPAPPGGVPIDCQVSDDGGGPCSGWFPVGTPITLKVESGNFTAWHRYCEGAEKICTFLTAGHAWINAEFDHLGGDDIPQKIDAPLKVKVSGGGTVTSSKSPDTAQSINCPANCTADFKYGEPVVLTAASGTLANWGRACSGAPKTCAMAAGTYREVTVAFAAAPTTTTPTTTTPTTTTPTTTTPTTTTPTTTTPTSKKQPVAQLTKVGFIARGKGGTIAATLGVRGEAKGSALLLQRKKTIARWRLSLAQGRRVVQLKLARRPRSGWYVLSFRLADRDGNGVVLNRNLRIR
jgi:hypothetical protein